MCVRGESGALTVARALCERSSSHLFIVCTLRHTRTHSHTAQLSTHIGVLIVELKDDYLYLVPQSVTLAG